MPRRDAEVPIIEIVTLTKTGTGFSAPVSLAKFGVKGRITGVIARLHTGGDATSVRFYIADSVLVGTAPSAVPADENVVYDSGDVVTTASATAASLNDNVEVDGGAPYDVDSDGKLQIYCNILASAGGTNTIKVSIAAVVTLSRPA